MNKNRPFFRCASACVLFFILTLIVFACGGGGGGGRTNGGGGSPSQSAPTIPNLSYSPTSAILNSGGGTVTICTDDML
jgi:hypothetical protein